MIVVYKYWIARAATTNIVAPEGWKPLTVQIQDDNLYIWALVDTSQKTQSYRICVYGTGHEITDSFAKVYLGTVQDSELVWHVFQDMRY